MNLGMTELLLLAGVALLFFGPSRLPGLGKSVGQAIRGFKKGISEDAPDEETEIQKKPTQLSHEAQSLKAEENKKMEADKNRQS